MSTIRQHPSLQLRKIGSRYMIVNSSSDCVNMANVFALNESAALLWQRMEGRECTPDELAQWLCDKYDVEYSVALGDVERQLAEWKKFGLVL